MFYLVLGGKRLRENMFCINTQRGGRELWSLGNRKADTHCLLQDKAEASFDLNESLNRNELTFRNQLTKLFGL